MAYIFQDLKKGIGNISFKSTKEAREWFSAVAKSLATDPAQRNIDQKEKLDWYQNNMENLTDIDRNRIMNSADPFKIFDKQDLMKSIGKDGVQTALGKMYMFMYDAKYKDILPYFDMFPLVFPIEFYSNGFLGINLHYLPPILRAGLMNSLYDLANNKSYTSTMKLNISYNILKNAGDRFAGFKECVKRYRTDRMRSNFHYVNPADWDKALLLPLQQWHINPNSRYNKSGNPPW